MISNVNRLKKLLKYEKRLPYVCHATIRIARCQRPCSLSAFSSKNSLSLYKGRDMSHTSALPPATKNFFEICWRPIQEKALSVKNRQGFFLIYHATFAEVYCSTKVNAL